MVTLALYKGKGNFGNSIIRWWTKSRYSHCELVVNGLSYSSSVRDKGVRAKQISYTLDDWDFIEIPWAKEEDVERYFKPILGQPYDWWALIGSQVFNRRSHSSGAAFCSECCASALGLSAAQVYSPESLYLLVLSLNLIFYRRGFK